MYARLPVMISLVLTIVLFNGGVAPVANAHWKGSPKPRHQAISCGAPQITCAETGFNQRLWPGRYVGHDEPGVAFLGGKGSGNRMEYRFTLPSDPPPKPIPGRSYNFQTGGVFWFGMILCDTQSYPEQVSSCKADSDKNITKLQKYPGSAYMEMQFYAPGWVPWPDGGSCNATQWCAALNIDSVSYNPLTDQSLNDSCTNAIGGSEYVNFAFITKDGRAQAPSNPIEATYDGTYTPNVKKDLFMNSGDSIVLRMHDTRHGLKVEIKDSTTGQTGSMTASASNGFAQVKFAPEPSVQCTPIPYDFHPMYDTASSKGILPWGATQDNIEWVDEIGHFDWCTLGSSRIRRTGSCPDDGYEGIQHNRASDYDDTYCFPKKASTLVKVAGCLGTNYPGYDGASYVADWPDGNVSLHPGPTTLGSPTYGSKYSNTYDHAVLETDLPAIEPAIQCDIDTGEGCSHLPLTDAGEPAAFYPFFTLVPQGSTCYWSFGNVIPGLSTKTFGRNAQYGPITGYRMLKNGGGGKTHIQYTGFRNVLKRDPCGR